MSIRKRGARSYQVRVDPFPAQTVPTRAAAEKLELDLKTRRSLGDLYELPPITLGEAIDGTLGRIKATRDTSAKTTEYNERSAKFWKPLRATRIPMLRRATVEDVVQARAALHPQSAKNELEFLKRVLHDAKGRGQRVDDAIFEIPPVRHRPRRGRGLSVTELYELASWFPEHVSRLVLVAGLVGARQKVWFNLTDEMLDLKAATVTIPAALAKRRREHRIYLTELEASLLREQLMARSAGTSLVFPTVEGKMWTASRFGDRVWVRSIEAAVKNDLSKRHGAVDLRGVHLPLAATHGRVPHGAFGNGCGCRRRAPRTQRRRSAVSQDVPSPLRGREAHAGESAGNARPRGLGRGRDIERRDPPGRA